MDKIEQPFMTEGFKALLLQDTGIGTSELAARTCYKSFNKSNDTTIKNLGVNLYTGLTQDEYISEYRGDLHDLPHSDLLDSLAWTHHHHSVMEHVVLTYALTMSRGVLQELARQRISSPSVKSTRYTMKDIIDAYVASENNQTIGSREWFVKKVKTFKMFCITGSLEDREIESIYDKLYTYEGVKLVTIADTCLSNEAKKELEISLEEDDTTSDDLFQILQICKAKRNAGDSIKFIVTDTWLTEVVWTINLRSLKNFLELRNSGAAWKPMQYLAQQIEQATPTKYLSLILKSHKGKK